MKDERPHWYLPGGYIEHDEQPSAACEREVFEETGLIIKTRRLLVQEWQSATTRGRLAHWSLLFDGGQSDSAQPLSPHDEEILEARWMSCSDAVTLLTPGLVRRLTAWWSGSQPATIYLEHTT